MRARITGQVEIEAVILADGTVGRTRVSRSLDPTYGLDELAEKAAQQWRFEPATLNGRPVASTAKVVLDFRLR